MSDATSGGSGDDGLPKRRVTFNMLLGYNVAFYRRALGESQAEFGVAMGGWSPASVSAAERSWEGRRVRKFDADEVARIADHFGVPVIAMFLPPADAGTAVDYLFDFGSDTPAGVASLLNSLASPRWSQPETAAVVAYRERLMALGDQAGDIGHDSVALEVLRRGWKEWLTRDAGVRATALERDAQDRWRRAMERLAPSYEEFERRINDLRDFEREYRMRLIAFLESHLQELRSVPGPGATEEGFPSIPPASEVMPQPGDRQ